LTTIDDLLAQLQRQDVRLGLDQDKLRISAPTAALTPELKSEIAARKPELIAALKRGARSDASMAPCGFDPRDPATVADPYPVYAWLRETDPVHRSPMGPWVITRYEDVAQALADPRLGNAPAPYSVVHERNADRYVSASLANNILPFIDPPRHTPLRGTISRTFRQHLRSVPSDIGGEANRLLLAARDKGEIDLVHDFGRPLSLAVFGRILGVPEQDWAQLKHWSEAFFYLFVPVTSDEVLATMEQHLSDFRAYFAELVEQRRRSPRSDLISELIGTRDDAHPLSNQEIIDTCILLFSDGVENIDSAIGNGVIALMTHPEQRDLLLKKPELIDSAVDECLRFDAPSQFVARTALADVELQGQTIAAGEAALLVLASANRDPARFDHADRLEISRTDNPHLTFGRGNHFCIGAQIVRAHIRAGLSAVFERLQELELEPARVRRADRMGHRWLDELPVAFAPF
jgi:hypothetical protein